MHDSDESKNGNQNIIKDRPARLVERLGVIADPSPMKVVVDRLTCSFFSDFVPVLLSNHSLFCHFICKTNVVASPSPAAASRQTTAHVSTRSPKAVGSHHSPAATSKQSTGRHQTTQPSSQTSSPMKHVHQATAVGGATTGGEVQWQVSGTALYKSDCPLRCVLAMGEDLDRGKSDSGNERRLLVVGSNDKSVKVLAYGEQHDVANDANDSVEVVRVFNDVHRGSVYAMDCVHNGTRGDELSLLATASNDKAIRLIKYVVNLS